MWKESAETIPHRAELLPEEGYWAAGGTASNTKLLDDQSRC